MTAAPEAAPGAGPPAAAPSLLSINNIEVIYDEVILVLRGLSLEVPKGQDRRSAGIQRRRQVDHAQGGVGPASQRAGGSHDRIDLLRW